MLCLEGESMPELNTVSSTSDNRVILELEGLSYTYPGSGKPILEGINLSLAAGSCSLITGDTGCGKSTLLLAIMDLLPEGSSKQGYCKSRDSGNNLERKGLVLQNPETQILCPTVGSECAFGLENICVPASRMRELVTNALQEVGLDEPLDTPVEYLSMGQKYRLLLASMLVMDPELLLMDEPSAQLDAQGLRLLKEVIIGLKKKGIGFVIAEHNPDSLMEIVDQDYRLEDGILGKTEKHTHAASCSGTYTRFPPIVHGSGTKVVRTEKLAYSYPSGERVWRDVWLEVEPGERIVLTGANSTGKSTFLRCLCGFLRPEQGSLELLGGKPRPSDLVGRVGYMFQNPQRQLFETTVAADIAFTLERLGWDSKSRRKRVHELLESCSLANVAEVSPYKLSFGQQHLAALAAVLAPEPEILLLDDPFVGLDSRITKGIIQIICELSDKKGMAVLYTDHHEERNFPWSHSRYKFAEGTLFEENNAYV